MLTSNTRNHGTAEAGKQHWYALAVKPRHDKAVSRTLGNKGYETLVPVYRKRHKYAARLKETELPLFPGYVFCRFNPLAKLPVLTTPGVVRILGAGQLPIPVDETEIASLQTALKTGLAVQPLAFLQTGQRVRITEGSLAGIEGIIMSLKPCLRLVLSITLLRRSVLVEVDRFCVHAEGIGAPDLSCAGDHHG
jgi:transcription antitermination factor NusG